MSKALKLRKSRAKCFAAALAIVCALTQAAVAQTPPGDEASRAEANARDALSTGDFSAARAAEEQAVNIRERRPVSDPLALAASLARLAMLTSLSALGLEDSLKLYQRALALCERQLGPNHIGVARLLDEMARVHVGMAESANPAEAGDHLQLAIGLLRRSLSIRERALGPNHPDVAIGLYNYALQYTWRDRGDFRRARPMFERALTIREVSLGPDHRLTLESLLRSAELYESASSQSEFEKANLVAAAESLRERAIAVQERLHGHDAPELLDNLNALTGLNLDAKLGDVAKARGFLERAVSIVEKAFPDGDFSFDARVERAAMDFRSAVPGAAADALVERVLTNEERALARRRCPASNDSGLLKKVNHSDLLGIFDRDGSLAGAEELGGNELDYRANWGENLLYTRKPCDLAAMYFDLAGRFKGVGDFESAERIYKAELARVPADLSASDGSERRAKLEYAAFLASRQRNLEAIALFEAVLRNLRHDYDYDRAGLPRIGRPLEFFGIVDALSKVYRVEARNADARTLNLAALTYEEGTHNPNLDVLRDRMVKLADADAALGLDAEAERLLKRVASTFAPDAQREPGQIGPNSAAKAKALDRLAAFYESRGRGAEAYAAHREALASELPSSRDLKLHAPSGAVFLSCCMPSPIVDRLEDFSRFCRRWGRDVEADQSRELSLSLRAIGLEQEILDQGLTLSADTSDRYVEPRLAMLVKTYRDLGRTADAVRVATRRLSGLERQYGYKSRDVADAMNDLASLYDLQGLAGKSRWLRAQAARIVNGLPTNAAASPARQAKQ